MIKKQNSYISSSISFGWGCFPCSLSCTCSCSGSIFCVFMYAKNIVQRRLQKLTKITRLCSGTSEKLMVCIMGQQQTPTCQGWSQVRYWLRAATASKPANLVCGQGLLLGLGNGLLKGLQLQQAHAHEEANAGKGAIGQLLRCGLECSVKKFGNLSAMSIRQHSYSPWAGQCADSSAATWHWWGAPSHRGWAPHRGCQTD